MVILPGLPGQGIDPRRGHVAALHANLVALGGPGVVGVRVVGGERLEARGSVVAGHVAILHADEAHEPFAVAVHVGLAVPTAAVADQDRDALLHRELLVHVLEREDQPVDDPLEVPQDDRVWVLARRRELAALKHVVGAGHVDRAFIAFGKLGTERVEARLEPAHDPFPGADHDRLLRRAEQVEPTAEQNRGRFRSDQHAALIEPGDDLHDRGLERARPAGNQESTRTNAHANLCAALA